MIKRISSLLFSIKIPNNWFVILFLAAIYVIGISLFRLPGPMEDIELDWTWQAALVYFAAHRLQFGPDVLYTYGPLGFLQVSINPGIFYLPMFLGRVVMALLAATVLGMMAWRSKSLFVIFALTFCIFLFSQFEADSLPLTINTILACFCLSLDPPLALLIFAPTVAALVSLIKFTYFTHSLACMSIIIVYFLITRQSRRAILVLSSFIISFLLFWTVVAHQHLGGLLSFVRGSAEIAKGFNETMFTAPQGNILSFAIFQAVLLIISALFLFLIRPLSMAAARTIIIALSAFVMWKQGIVRADSGHAMVIPLGAQLLSILLFVQFKEIGPRPRRIKALAVSTIICSILASCGFLHELWMIGGPSNLFSVSRAASAFASNTRLLFDYSGYNSFLSKITETAKLKYAFPKISSDIGNSTVDIFGDEGGIAILNGWNYLPRPVFQSFSAYTKFLIDRNERFVSSDYGPEYYLVKLNAIDGRLPIEADSTAFEAILSRYEPVDAERGYLLFRKREIYQTRIFSSGLASINQTIPIDPSSETGRMIELELELEPSLLGLARTLIFHPASVTLRVRTTSNDVADFRLLPTLARYGIPLWPQFGDVTDLNSMLSGHKVDLVSSIEVHVADEDRVFFNPNFSYSFKQILAPTVVPNMNYVKELLEFGAEPESIKAPNHPRIMTAEGRNVLYVHAPSSIILKVPADANKVFGVFGVLPGAFSPGNNTQTVTFGVATLGEAAQTIFQQDIMASQMKPFEIALPKDHPEKIELKADCHPGCDGGWSYWGGLSFDVDAPANLPKNTYK